LMGFANAARIFGNLAGVYISFLNHYYIYYILDGY
jgi:hypothetical protein